MEALLFSVESKPFEPRVFRFDQLEEGISEIVGDNLRVFRQRLGYTQQQHADIMAVSLSQYRKYEAGRDTPRFHTLCRWSMITGCSCYNLLRNTAYGELMAEFLTPWRMMPFSSLIGRLKDRPFLALVQLVHSLGFTCDILIPNDVKSSLDKVDMELAFAQLETDTYRAAATQLRIFREERGLSQESMAEYLGVNVNTYRNYESPQQAPKFTFLLAVRFFLVFGCHFFTLTKGSICCHYMQQKLNRLRFLTPMLNEVNESQYQQIKAIFSAVEGTAEDNQAYLF